MTEVEKFRVLLPHLTEHNRNHEEEYAKWATVLSDNEEQAAADLIKKAIQSMKNADHYLDQALKKLGGPLKGQHHHNH